jgi:hypothetical protein
MAVYENLKTFAGKPVKDFKQAGDIRDFTATTPRLRCDYDGHFELRDFLALMLDEPGVGAAQAVVFGAWMEGGESYEVTPTSTIEMLVSMKDRLPDLRSLFFGDIISEENEMSWIEQGDYSAIWAAFPRLEYFAARGGNNLRLGTINHRSLQSLAYHADRQAGGLPVGVVREALSANAPLRHLELWLGTDNYGANSSVADFDDLFAGMLFPDLHTLALRNSDYSDDLAEALAEAPILDRIKVLDLSMGTISDKGVRALIGSSKVSRLEKLDISHHYASPEMVAELGRATPNLVADEALEAEEWDGELQYYVAVSE